MVELGFDILDVCVIAPVSHIEYIKPENERPAESNANADGLDFSFDLLVYKPKVFARLDSRRPVYAFAEADTGTVGGVLGFACHRIFPTYCV